VVSSGKPFRSVVEVLAEDAGGSSLKMTSGIIPDKSHVLSAGSGTLWQRSISQGG
jgi:hypothetical protein